MTRDWGEAAEGRRAVLLGAYGLIGAACLGALRAAGFSVVGVGRSARAARRCAPDIKWHILDIARASADDWRDVFADADVVINVSGILQDGPGDSLTAIHDTAIGAMVEAMEGSSVRFIQISAAGVSDTAPTDFLRSKARGDRRIMESALDWVVLRPSLVLSPHAYGGTALLRAMAAMPGIGLQAFPQAPLQTVSVEDVAHAVVQAACGDVPGGTLADLTEEQSRSTAEVLARTRAWLGYRPWRKRLTVPPVIARLVGGVADGLGWFGWRSPLRTSALVSLESGVIADPSAWAAAGGRPCRGLDDTLRRLPATVQERTFARLYLLLPLMIGVLAAFWLLLGVVALWQNAAAQAVLTDRGMEATAARAMVFGGAVVDVVLGVVVLWRRWMRAACFAMIVVSLAYLVGATLWAPDLWADPLGTLIKVLPAMTLALMATVWDDGR